MLETMDQYDVIKATGEGAFGKAYLAKGKSECKPCVIRDRFCKGKEVQISAHFQWCNQLAFHSVRKGIIFRFVFKRLNCNSQVSFVPTPKSIVQTATNVLLLKRKGKKEEKKIGLYVWYTLGWPARPLRAPPPFCSTQFCPRAVHVLRCLSLFKSPPQGGLPQTLEKWLPASIPPYPTLIGTTVSVGSLQGLPQGSRGHTANSSDAPAMPTDLHWDGA